MLERFIPPWLCLALLWGLLAPDAPLEAVCVKVKRANLRQGPGLKYKKLWEVLQYMPFKKVGHKGAWWKVQDVDGDFYWAHQRLFTTRFRCAVIKQNQTNLRSGPGTRYPPVSWSPVDKYFSLKVLKIKNQWVQVMDAAGDRAWVYRPLVWIQ